MRSGEKYTEVISWDTAEMQLSMAPGTTKKFRTTGWKYQKTFETPSRDVRGFVQSALSAIPSIQGAHLAICTWIFEPKYLIALMDRHSVHGDFQRDSLIEATGEIEATALLEAALRDAVDFTFVPEPKPFSAYADHDGYITFYAQTRGNLNRVVHPLEQQGFKMVEGWERRF